MASRADSATLSATVHKSHKAPNRGRLKVGKIDGIYVRGQVFWFQPPQNNGIRPKPFSLKTSDEGEAIRKVLEWRASPQLQTAAEWELELDGYLRDQMADRRLSRFYASSRRAVLMAFAREYDISSPVQITEAICQGWYDALKAKNLHTAKHYLVHLRVFLDFLKDRRKVITANPARGIRMVRVKQKAKVDFVEKRKVRRLLAFARLETRRAKSEGDAEKAREVEFMLYMGFDAGMRKNEMIEARDFWFTRSRGAVHIAETATYRPKDLEDRTVPLTGRFQRFLKREYPHGLPDGWVIHPDKRPGKQLYRYEPKKALAGVFQRAGVRSVGGRLPNIHMARHSFASNRLIDGQSLYRVAKWLGDDQDTTQRHYGHLMPHDAEINRGV